MESVCVLLVLLSFFGVFLFNRVDCRQMCLSCQYVDNPAQQGIECATDPWNWAWGNPRMRCPYRCFLDAQFNKDTGEPIYMYRGCTQENRGKEGEGCFVGKEKEFCWSSCEGSDYCNNRTFSIAPSKDLADSGTDSRHHGHHHYRLSFRLLLCCFALVLVSLLLG